MLVASLTKSECLFSGFKSFSLTSLELQMLTNSCVKLQTVHNVPLTINKEGESLFICFIKNYLPFFLGYLKHVMTLIAFFPI